MTEPRTKTRKLTGELERLGSEGNDIMVLGIDAPGFEELTLDQKRFCYYLYRAAIPGNRIAFMQSHRDALDIKSILEQIYLHSDSLDPQVRGAVHDYLKYVWIHHGQYNHYTHAKFTPNTLTQEMLATACEAAVASGAALPLLSGESPRDMVERFSRTIFDADHEPLQTNQSEGVDIIATSAVNYWDPDVTAADLDALDPKLRDRLNVRFAKRDGRVIPEVYRIGGLYSDELETISHFITLAIPYAESEAQRVSLELLLEYYATGDEEIFRKHCVQWLQSDGKVDYLNGFIEVYLDPRGLIGQIEANVSFKASGGLIDEVSDNSLYFERRMPWPDQYKRTEVTPPVASVVNVLIETGDAGPVSPAAYNLPNYNDIRRDHGSKNVIIHNVENTWSRELLQRTVDEFFLPEYRDNMMAYARTIWRPLQVYMHEIIGHGSGTPDPSLTADPRALLGRVYSSLEECRADLVALYHVTDPRLVEIGAFDGAERHAVVETAYISYVQGWFARIDHVPGHEVREAHDRGHHTIMMYLLEGGGEGKDFGVEMTQEDGDYFLRLTNLDRVHEGLGELLSKIQVIKSTGDATAAESLFSRFGTRLDPAWKANVAVRTAKLNTPKIKAFVFPRLEPIVKDGELTDVVIHCDEDLTAQQLRFSRLELSRDLKAG